MTFTLKTGLMKSLKSFDEELQRYFGASARYRAASRSGGIILIVDHDDRLFRLVTFLVEKTGIEVKVVQLDTPGDARKLIEEGGPSAVKAVILDADLLASTNGSFNTWVQASGVDVPVFIKGSRDQVITFKASGFRFGVFIEQETTAMDYAEALGFPERCRALVSEFEAAAGQ
jgi:hypothetical protein